MRCGLVGVLLVALLVPAVPVLAKDGSCKCGEPQSGWQQVLDALGTPATIGAIGVVAGGFAWFAWSRRWAARALLLLPGYARLSRDEVLAHPARSEALALVRRAPASNLKDLAVLGGRNAGTMRYHLAVLERAHLVRSARVGRERVWVDAAAPMKPDAATLRAPVRRRLVELLVERPGLALSQLARSVERSKATTHHHLRELTRAGLATATRHGLRVRYHALAPPPPAPALPTVLAVPRPRRLRLVRRSGHALRGSAPP